MKFKDLKIGEKFIVYPDEPDNDTRPYWIFMKIVSTVSEDRYEDEIPLRWNAVREHDGSLSNMTDDMLVLHIE